MTFGIRPGNPSRLPTGSGPCTRGKSRISIIIPVRDEAAGIEDHLLALRRQSSPAEIVVVDGGSRDGTAEIARRHADRMVVSIPGRAHQINAGLRNVTGDIIVFLHADTKLPVDGLRQVRRLAEPNAPVWGRFDVRIEGRSGLLPIVAALMNLRSRLTGIATGDQAIFATRATLDRIGGVPDIPIMEDIALSRALRRIGRPLCLRERVITSGRRWDANGPLRTIVMMWGMRLAYFVGVPPDRLARFYGSLKRG